MSFLRFLPKIKIHTWGGLGSQLYAIALSIDLYKQFPYRQYEYVCHSGGTTKREPEIQFYSSKIRVINDFSNNEKSVTGAKRKKKLFNFAKTILYSVGVLAHCNDDVHTLTLKPWVLVIRGHYSSREITIISAKIIVERINSRFPIGNETNISRGIAVHYRLGDLEVISEKSPISSKKLQNTIKTILELTNTNSINLYSDSILSAKKKLLTGLNNLEIISREQTPLETIHECINSDIFIGTNSKISIWIAVLRATKTENQFSYLPKEIRHMIIGSEKSFIYNSIKFY